jgi:phage terminase large subunit
VQLESFKAFQQGYRIIVNQGGTSSGKTRGITKLLIGLAYRDKYEISMTSVSFPHLRKGVLKDWRIVMEQYELYNVQDHTRTEQTYHYPTGSYMEFFSVDDHLKVRGPRRDILFINEANLISYDTFLQLLLRTRVCVFIDYNPADEFHWIYDKVLPRPDCYYIQTTYKDNPFLPDEQIKEIENLKDADENYWKVYGLGERGHSEGVIFTHWQPFSTEISGQIGYGLDFGYNNPTALCRVVQFAGGIQVTEEFYQSKVTNTELIEVLKQLVSPYDPIYCDAAEPARIEEIKRAGFKALPANKDVKAGIDFIKSRKLFIHQGSVNLLKEIKSYKFKVNKNKVGNTPEEPLKLNDHAMDAMRYAAISFKQPKVTFHTTFHKT